MDEAFKIYIDQLRGGKETEIHEELDPEFLDICEPDLTFEKKIKLDGRAYLAENELVLNWTINAEALIACLICSQKVPVDIEIDHAYESVPLTEIRSGIYNFKEILREAILLELPAFAECNQGNCPKRKEYAKYLKEPSPGSSDKEGHRPFADLDWE